MASYNPMAIRPDTALTSSSFCLYPSMTSAGHSIYQPLIAVIFGKIDLRGRSEMFNYII